MGGPGSGNKSKLPRAKGAGRKPKPPTERAKHRNKVIVRISAIPPEDNKKSVADKLEDLCLLWSETPEQVVEGLISKAWVEMTR